MSSVGEVRGVTTIQSTSVPVPAIAQAEDCYVLRMPADILRILLGTEQYLDNESKMVCRFVCRTFKVLTNVTYDEYDRGIFCKNIAQKGNLELLAWAHYRGAPMYYSAEAAASKLHFFV